MKWVKIRDYTAADESYMIWPVPDGDLEWTLIHGSPTKENLLSAASILAAYNQMIADPREKRQRIVREIRNAMKEGYA